MQNCRINAHLEKAAYFDLRSDPETNHLYATAAQYPGAAKCAQRAEWHRMRAAEYVERGLALAARKKARKTARRGSQ